jgi:hypothetical protein
VLLVLLLISLEVVRAQGDDSILVNERIGFLTRQTDRGVLMSRGSLVEPDLSFAWSGINLAASGYYGVYDTTPKWTLGEVAIFGGYQISLGRLELEPGLKYRLRPLDTDRNILEANVSTGYPLGPLRLVLNNALAWPGGSLPYYGDAIASGGWNPSSWFELAADAALGWGSPGYHARQMYDNKWAFDHLTGDISVAYTVLDVFRLCPWVSYSTMLDPDLAAALRARNRLAGLSAGVAIEAVMNSKAPGQSFMY